MTSISTHVLDTSKGFPASGIHIELFRNVDGNWTLIARGDTNSDGRITDFLKEIDITFGKYKMRFNVENYFKQQKSIYFYPYVEVVFLIEEDEHYHVPLLLSPFGYSTYRGS